MSRDFKDPENLKKLLKASKDAKEKKMLKKQIDHLAKEGKRTSKKAGKLFTLKGKPKLVSGGKPNFVKGSTGGPLVKSAPRSAVKSGKKMSSALTKTIPKRAIREVGKQATKNLGKLALGTATAGAGLLASEILLPEDVGQGQDIVPGQKAMRVKDEMQLALNEMQGIQPPLTPEQLEASSVSPPFKPFPVDMLEPEEEVKEDIEAVERSIKPSAKNTSSSLDQKKGKSLGPKGSSPKSDFMEALTFFAPALIGGGIGALFEGGAGAVAGIEQGQSLADAFRKKKQQDFENKLMQQKADNAVTKARLARLPKEKALQQSKIFHAKTKEPLVFNPNTGKYQTAAGVNVPPEMLIEGTESRFSRKEAQLSPEQNTQLQGFKSVPMHLKDIADLKSRINTGPFAGRGQQAAELVGLAPKEFSRLRVKTKSLVQDFARMKQGSRISDVDLAFNEELLPNVNDDDVTFDAKLQAISEIMATNQEAFEEAIVTGQPLKADAVSRIKKSFQELDKRLPKLTDEEKAQRKAEQVVFGPEERAIKKQQLLQKIRRVKRNRQNGKR